MGTYDTNVFTDVRELQFFVVAKAVLAATLTSLTSRRASNNYFFNAFTLQVFIVGSINKLISNSFYTVYNVLRVVNRNSDASMCATVFLRNNNV